MEMIAAMAPMISEAHDAFRAAGASEGKARAAASAVVWQV
jgi:hypothetical protein